MSRTRTKESSQFKAGLAREIITSARGAPLAGYFNPRPNKGVLDELYVKALLFEIGNIVAGIVSFDLLYLSRPLVEKIKAALKKRNLRFGGNLIFCATHTHTGPYVLEVYEGKADSDYVGKLVKKAVLAVERAYRNLSPAELSCASVKNNPFAFNRRYFMKGGGVVTNPGKLNPDIVKPEGIVDREIGVLAVRQDGRITGIITNITNHTDTIGGNLVSADWPARMEKYIQNALGYDVPVITLIGPSGNVNHFDVSSKRNQTCYGEAKKIGRGYGEIVVGLLGRLKRFACPDIRVRKRTVKIPYRKLSSDEIIEAKRILKEKPAERGGNLTSEDLAKGDAAVRRFFAEELQRFHKLFGGKKARLEFMSVAFGRHLAIAGLPGEPFSEIGVKIKKKSPFRLTLVAALANDSCGYIPLKECFARGGYEILPVAGGGLTEGAAEIFIDESVKLLKINWNLTSDFTGK